MRGLIFVAVLMMNLTAFADLQVKLTPYQTSLQNCFGKTIDIQTTDNHRKLYSAIEKAYSLVLSETTYREVVYKQRNEEKKLRFENGIITVFEVNEEDESLKVLSTENMTEAAGKTNELRHRPLSADARIRQLLIRADIRSDFSRVRERRSGGLVLNISWSDQHIRTLQIDFLSSKKSLNCTQKDSADICTCSG